MIKRYPYLKDVEFLNKIYGLHNQTIYTQITVLDWQEKRIADVQGKTISGSISVNGDSSVRRTASLSIYIESYEELYNNIDSLFSLNKKVFLEIGIKNTIRHLSQYNYPEYGTIWFPFGTFIIQSASISHDASNGVSLSLSLGDKMCLLNGDAGGTIPASTNFESYDTLAPNGDIKTEAIRINEIIPELVNHFGGESLNKIIVTDIDNKIKQVMKWRGSQPLYLWEDKSNPKNSFYTMSDNIEGLDVDSWSKTKIIYNYDAGYTYVDFTYPGELSCGAGDTVCTILDKIKDTLGNFEYFYDIFGTFHFQEIKNYKNTSPWRQVWSGYKNHLHDLDNDSYLPYNYNIRLNSRVYDFKDSNFIINYSNAPQFNMIKNDFIVWGIRKSDNNLQIPCRYHLAIDKRPFIEDSELNPIDICFDTSVQDGVRRCYDIKGGVYASLDDLKADKPVGIVGEYYIVANYINDEPTYDIYSWITDIQDYNNKLNNFLNSADTPQVTTTPSGENEQVVAGYLKMPLATYYKQNTFTIPAETDWRNILYFHDLYAAAQGLETSYYWAEMCNEWPKIYNVEQNQWMPNVLDSPSSLDWWLDIIDNDSILSQFSVDSIGRRSYAKVESSCNCVFEPDIPNILMVNVAGEDMVDIRSGKTIRELNELGLNPVQVSQAIYDSVTIGGSFNSCYQIVRQLLTDYTDYNENITVNCLPIYHLEPNTRVHFQDVDSGINGDYIINNISFDLSHSGTMNINAKKVIEKL